MGWWDEGDLTIGDEPIDRLTEVFCVRLYDCTFPEPGVYFLELWYDGVWVVDQRLELTEGGKMSQKPDQPSTGGVQVFERTMDNPEDQDELNRRLRKPGESGSGASPENGPVDRAEPTAEADRGHHPGP